MNNAPYDKKRIDAHCKRTGVLYMTNREFVRHASYSPWGPYGHIKGGRPNGMPKIVVIDKQYPRGRN